MNKYLLDTHVLLWMQDDNIALSKAARKILEDSTTQLYLSIASLWEITIKQSLGKLQLQYSLEELIDSCNANKINILPIDFETLKILKTLPFIHCDPFDRIIIATSMELDLDLISSDEIAKKYITSVIW
ncbi:type II toxin-antitoxin system VapC family toxin [Pedobacter sp. D749]|uniref:type II toxin-antitoxin system VapC family toxin n=1 Tax=Pedobacter sp. D749 TaxID=2856523 RepID=UPI001C5727BA|nr:type II toxin-antitoxin system VapC family toxin [Pedobacter sp. D749]QXU41839.1 type II toxin-antitoxin system VapC family toxin [Pedobacter sp. D749]